MEQTFLVSGKQFKSHIDGLQLHPKVALCANDKRLYVDRKSLNQCAPWALHHDALCVVDGIIIDGERYYECENVHTILRDTRNPHLAELCTQIDDVVMHVFGNY